MKLLDAIQGTPEWLAIRNQYRVASDAPVMMSASSKMSRRALVMLKATGGQREFSEWAQRNLLDKGHEIEASARGIAEAIIGEPLYPIVCADDDGYMMASLDGATLLGDTIWECKSWNEAKAVDLAHGELPKEDAWQVIQQLAVTGAARCLYMVSDGTEARTQTLWVDRPEPLVVENLLNGWKQFDEDVAQYVHKETPTQPAGMVESAGVV